MIPAEIVPCEEDILHGYMMLEALAVGVGQPSEPTVVHANREVEPLDVAGRETWLVEMRASSGLPNRVFFLVPILLAGL